MPTSNPKRALLAAWLSLGCASRAPGDTSHQAAGAVPAALLPSARPSPPGSSSAAHDSPREQPTLLITNPRVLVALEARGLSLGALFADRSAPNNRELSTSPPYFVFQLRVDGHSSSLR